MISLFELICKILLSLCTEVEKFHLHNYSRDGEHLKILSNTLLSEEIDVSGLCY